MARDDFIGIALDGEKQVQRILTGWPREARDEATNAGAKYLVDRFKAQPPPKSITRKAAYGTSFFSDRQRKWFFANLREGNISVPYRRTQEMRNAWEIIGQGEDLIIVNQTQAAVYTMGDDTRSQHEEMVGWKTISQHIQEGAAKLAARMTAAGEKALKKLGAR